MARARPLPEPTLNASRRPGLAGKSPCDDRLEWIRGLAPMATKALLYSADAPDETPELATIDIDALTERQLLWIDLGSPTAAELQQVASLLGCDPGLLRIAIEPEARPSLANYSAHFRITAKAVRLETAAAQVTIEPLTLIAGSNHVVTVHKAGLDFLDELRNREKGESMIGVLSSESFVASLLDWLLNSYFQALEALVRDIDRVEVAILGEKITPQLLDVLIAARQHIADLRRVLISHRGVFYGLDRPDFIATERAEAKPHFEALNNHYERVEDDLDNARDLVVGSFELLSTRAAQKTNDTMRALTFITVLMGTLALVAGMLGMNFDLKFFQTGTTGFVIVAVSMLGFSALSVWVAFKRRWI
jgi:Mg2+ and Co2+ transporter CorA